jgi:hypothetical protein
MNLGALFHSTNKMNECRRLLAQAHEFWLAKPSQHIHDNTHAAAHLDCFIAERKINIVIE